MTSDETLRQTLRDARNLFQTYGDNHMAKDPPQRGKAWTNYIMVDRINRALAADSDVS